MAELALRYGTNPHQDGARVAAAGALPFTVLGGTPGYINFLDALNSWQLVREARRGDRAGGGRLVQARQSRGGGARCAAHRCRAARVRGRHRRALGPRRPPTRAPAAPTA